jgi:hypothetical protein
MLIHVRKNIREGTARKNLTEMEYQIETISRKYCVRGIHLIHMEISSEFVSTR